MILKILVNIHIVSDYASNFLITMRSWILATTALVASKSRITCAFCSLSRTRVNRYGDEKEDSHKQIYHSTAS